VAEVKRCRPDDVVAALLGYGRDDALEGANDVLAAALPKDRVFTRPGKHDWSVWRKLLAEMLGHPALTGNCLQPSEGRQGPVEAAREEAR
jgi:hypothetical protein